MFLTLLAMCCLQLAFLSVPLSATTYYLSANGYDGNSGLSASQPWLTPKHTVNCGDVILAAPSTSYYSENFNSGKWGTVNCAGKNNVAWLQCQTFDGCKIYSTNYGINVDQSFWGVQGWEVTVASGAPGFCFGTAPSNWHPAEVHHIIFANNVANGCQSGGFTSWNSNSTTGVDYLALIGNIAYNAAQSTSECNSGISVFQPVQADSVSGTHIYVAGNFSYGNYQPTYCGGVKAWGAGGLIFDTFDGSQGLAQPYTAQAVATNNMVLGNGGHGIEIQNNVAGSQHALIIVQQNTSWGNEAQGNQQANSLCAEILVNSGYNVHVAYNLAYTATPNACAGSADPLYALSGYTVNGTVWLYNNFATGYHGQNTFEYGGSYGLATNNVLGQDPYLRNSVTPGAPSCGGTGNTVNCMASTISNFTATSSAASGMGYQKPGAGTQASAYFPQWVCSVNLPSGLINKGC